MINKTIDIDTDVSAFVFFHPADLTECQDYPIAWYMYPFCYEKYLRQGKMFGFATGADGRYRLLLTDAELTEVQAAAVAFSYSFPYLSRHGSLFVDNTDGLPGSEQMDLPSDFPERFIELEPAGYKVVVSALKWQTDDHDQPDYVLQFEKCDAIEGIATDEVILKLDPYRFTAPVKESCFGSSRATLELNGDIVDAVPVILDYNSFSVSGSGAISLGLDSSYADYLFGKGEYADHESIDLVAIFPANDSEHGLGIVGDIRSISGGKFTSVQIKPHCLVTASSPLVAKTHCQVTKVDFIGASLPAAVLDETLKTAAIKYFEQHSESLKKADSAGFELAALRSFTTNFAIIHFAARFIFSTLSEYLSFLNQDENEQIKILIQKFQ